MLSALPFQPLAESTGIWDLIAKSGLVAQFVYVLLLSFSVLSWAIILRKLALFSRVEKTSKSFLGVFHESHTLADIHRASGEYRNSPMVGIFQAGFSEMNAQIHVRSALEDGATPAHLIKSINSVERTLRKASAVELTSLERSLNWLATTASATPFIGLFGTVVGIINAFHGLGQEKTTTIQAVAPGISEALVATAFGLFAAIPAVIFYNHFLSRIKHMASIMDDFSTELVNLIERNFT